MNIWAQLQITPSYPKYFVYHSSSAVYLNFAYPSISAVYLNYFVYASLWASISVYAF